MAINVNLSVSLPSQLEVDDFVYGLGYQDNIDGRANIQTKAQFAKEMIIKYIRDIIRAKRAGDAVEVVRSSKITEVDALIIL